MTLPLPDPRVRDLQSPEAWDKMVHHSHAYDPQRGLAELEKIALTHPSEVRDKWEKCFPSIIDYI